MATQNTHTQKKKVKTGTYARDGGKKQKKKGGTVVPQQVDLFFRGVGVKKHRGGLRGVTALLGVNAEDDLKSAPEEPGWS